MSRSVLRLLPVVALLTVLFASRASLAGMCSAATCASLGANCGTPADGCGGNLSCGTCASGQYCNGSDVCTACSTCASLGDTCGTPADGCGNVLSCGTCPAGKYCNGSYQCVACATCASLGAACGTPSDGCGNTLSCGTCSSGQSCGATYQCATVSQTTTTMSFGAGALVIPMDGICYNQTGDTSAGMSGNNGTSCVAGTTYPCYANYSIGDIRLPYGMIYLLAKNNVPVNIALNPTKLALTDADFTVTPPAGSTTQTSSLLLYGTSTYAVSTSSMTCGTNTVYYTGMPLVIDAPFAQQALQVLQTFNATNSVFSSQPIHVVNYPFTAPIIGTLASRPKPVGIDGGPLDTYLAETGLDQVFPDGSYKVYITGTAPSFSYTWPASLTAPSACPGGTCSTLVYTSGGVTKRIIDDIWTSSGSYNNWSDMPNFFKQGGTVLAVAAATYWEAGTGGVLGGTIGGGGGGAVKGNFCSTMATNNANLNVNPGPTTNYPASNRMLQLGNQDLFVHGVGGGDASSYTFGSAPAAGTAALDDDTAYVAIAGHPMVSGVQQNSSWIVYLGSLNSWHGAAANKDGGLHIMYNTLLGAGNGNGTTSQFFAATEISRSSAVASATGESYLGTFDWQIPQSATDLGNVLYTPPPGTYPYATGHFREFKAPVANSGSGGRTSVAYNATSYGLNSTCSSSSASSPCNWDAASLMSRFASRNVYVITPGTTTLADAHTATLPAGWAATESTIATKLAAGVLGAIDYGTAAVIEAKPTGQVSVAGATTRPTIAYVGARDGMIHAFCVAPGSSDGSGKCYGSYPVGSEIWAIIPPGVQKQMITANSSLDWSSVNVGGALRVADFQDTYGGGSLAYRTILLAGTHDSGYVDAFDISNPNPSNLNSAGFQFLWENDGTTAVSGSPPAMGKTLGASFALVNSSTNKGMAIVTASSATGNGIVTYAMELNDGKVINYSSKSYTRKIPLVGNSTAAVPNDVPPLPTIMDVNLDGNDDTVFVTDFEGIVQKFPLTTAGLGTVATAYDASTSASCASGVACQPIGVSPSIGWRSSTARSVLFATGGADWARNLTGQSFYVMGFDATSNSQLFTPIAMPSITPPAPPGTFPLRSYAQATIVGTDMYINSTTLAPATMSVLILPAMISGNYGKVLLYNNVNTSTVTAGTYALPAGTVYGGGMSSILEVNTATGGALSLPGSSAGILDTTLGTSSTSLASTSYKVNVSSGTSGRAFNVSAWFSMTN